MRYTSNSPLHVNDVLTCFSAIMFLIFILINA
jgi:hypothetical protein